MNIIRNLNHNITHWPVTGSDGFGGSTFGPPELLKGRWQDVVELYRNAANEEVASNAVVYLLTDIDLGDYLALGDYTNTASPVTLNASGTIARVAEMQHRTTDLKALQALRKVFL